MTTNTFDDVIAGFYAAASGRKPWVDALAAFRHEVGADAIHFWALDTAKGRFLFSHLSSSVQQTDAELDYLTTYHLIDPRTRYPLEAKVNDWFNCWEHFDADYVARSRFYQEFLIPYGGRYVSALKLRHDGDQVLLLGIHRGVHRTPMGADELETCKRLARHLTDAAALEGLNALRVTQAVLGTELLERLRAPVMLLDGDRAVMHANPAARALMASTSAVVQSQGRLHCHAAADDANLLAGLHRLLQPTGDGAARADKLFVRAGGGTDEPIGLFLYALRPERTLGIFGERPLAMALLHRTGDYLTLDPYVVAAAYDLTPGEARVAVSTAGGATPTEISRDCGVSIHTVRSQLKNVFAKTGTTRQSQLVSALSALPMAALGL